MTRASLTRRLRKLEAGARASKGFGVYDWKGGQWASMTPGAALLFAGDGAPVRVIVGIGWADL